MGIVYDPMTGEPIETPDEETNNEVQENVETPENNEDTTNNLVITSEENETVTISIEEANAQIAQPAQPAQPASVFDNTPVEEVTEAPATETPSEDLKYEEPINDGNKNKNILYIALGVAAILVIAVICCIVALFSSKKAKVEKAFANTFDIKSELSEDLTKASKILNGKEYTLSYNVNSEDSGSFDGALILSENINQITLNADIDEFVPFSLLLQYDKDTIKAEIPQACDYVFSYNYRDDKDGFIVDELGDETVEELDKALQYIYDYNPEDDRYSEEMSDLLKKYYKELEFEDAGKETFKVDGEKVDCKGISVLIENDMMTDFYEEFYDIYMEQLEDSLGDFSDVADLDMIEDELKALEKDIKKIPDTEITFYIYKKALACIHIDTGKKKDNIDILFKGGDFRAQNIVVEDRDGEIFAIKMNLKDTKETYKISFGDEDYSISYNPEKGDVKVSFDDEELEFNFKVSDNDVNVAFDDIDFSYLGSFDFEFTLKKGASFSKFENEEEFDIGNASEDDIMGLVEDLDEDFTSEISGLF